MEAYHIDRFGSIDGIVLRSSEDPRPGPKEVLMRVRASSLNYRDLMVLKGGGRGPTKLGVIPLSDGAGEVAAIGDGVTRVRLGDRVVGCFHLRWFGGPLSADYLTDRLVAEERLVPDPFVVGASGKVQCSFACGVTQGRKRRGSVWQRITAYVLVRLAGAYGTVQTPESRGYGIAPRSRSTAAYRR